MENRLFELKLDEVRAVIGGATYYTSVNWLPMVSTPPATAHAPSRSLDTLPIR